MNDLAQAHQDYTDTMREYVHAKQALDNAYARPGKQKDNSVLARRARTTKMNFDVARVFYFALRAGDPVHIALAKAACYG